MHHLAPEDDWADQDEAVDFMALLQEAPLPDALRVWINASARRVLSTDGCLHIARPRAWRGPGTHLMNARPEPEDTPLWSIDTISSEGALRKAFPLGVIIHGLELLPQPEPFGYRLDLELTPEVALLLGTGDTRFTMDTSFAALARVPGPWPPERIPEMLPGFAVAMRAAGIDNPALSALEKESTRLREEAAVKALAEKKARAAERKAKALAKKASIETAATKTAPKKTALKKTARR